MAVVYSKSVFIIAVRYSYETFSSSSSSPPPPPSSSSSSSSLDQQPYVGPGFPQKFLPAEVSGYCFFRFRDESFPGWGCQPHA
jgi:hypothetical protein